MGEKIVTTFLSISLNSIMGYFIDGGGRRRKAINVNCKRCGKPFLIREKWAKPEGNYCSKKCAYEGMSAERRTTLTCDFCKKEFSRLFSKLHNSRSGLRFCSRECKDEAQQLDNGFTKIHPSHYGTGNGIYSYRIRAFRIYGKDCAECHKEKIEQLLDVHHIDGNRENNKKENLIVLCVRCHAKVTRGLAKIENRKLVNINGALV